MNSQQFRDSIIELQRQWQTTTRLRLGVFAIIAILVFWLILSMSDYHTTRLNQLAEVKQQQARLQKISTDNNHDNVGKALQQRRFTLEKRLLRTATRGLAQAEVRAIVEKILNDKGLSPDSLQVQTPQAAPPLKDAYSIAVTIELQLTPGSLFALLSTLESGPHLVVVDRYILRNNPRNSDPEKQRGSIGCRFFTILENTP